MPWAAQQLGSCLPSVFLTSTFPSITSNNHSLLTVFHLGCSQVQLGNPLGYFFLVPSPKKLSCSCVFVPIPWRLRFSLLHLPLSLCPKPTKPQPYLFLFCYLCLYFPIRINLGPESWELNVEYFFLGQTVLGVPNQIRIQTTLGQPTTIRLCYIREDLFYIVAVMETLDNKHVQTLNKCWGSTQV